MRAEWREAVERDGVVEVRQRPLTAVGLVATGVLFVVVGLWLGTADEFGGWGRLAPGVAGLFGWLAVGLGLVSLGGGLRILVRPPLVVRLDRQGVALPGGRQVAWSALRGADVEGAAGQARAVVVVDDPGGEIRRRTRGGLRRAPPGQGRIGLRPYHPGSAQELAELIVWARSRLADPGVDAGSHR